MREDAYMKKKALIFAGVIVLLAVFWTVCSAEVMQEGRHYDEICKELGGPGQKICGMQFMGVEMVRFDFT